MANPPDSHSLSGNKRRLASLAADSGKSVGASMKGRRFERSRHRLYPVGNTDAGATIIRG
jgi:hypothetical protein